MDDGGHPALSTYEQKRIRDEQDAIRSVCKILLYENFPAVPQEARGDANFAAWHEGLLEEVCFWWVTIGALPEGYRAFSKDLMEGRRPFQYAPHLAHFPEKDLYVLDVGSGPFTTLGTHADGRTLHISLADPLAAVFAKILEMFRIPWTMDRRASTGELLTETYAPGTFHLVCAQNALDHSINPLVCIRQMLEVARPGGVVVLRHIENEATGGGYNGLHQWNFALEEGRPVMWNTNRRYRLDEELPHDVRIEVNRASKIPRWGHDWADEWIEIVLKKPD